MKEAVKIASIILISVLLIINMPIYTNALSFDEIMQGADDFIQQGGSGPAVNIQESELQKISKTVSNVLLSIAVGVTLISAIVMGINFTIQSVEDKAKVKESMVPWVIGIFVAFGAYGIWKITMGVFYGLT